MTGVELITAERKRQIEEEGYDAEHDYDEFHEDGELALYACYYAMPGPLEYGIITIPEGVFFPDGWNPEHDNKNEKGRIRQLVIAGALCAAEIDRLRSITGTEICEWCEKRFPEDSLREDSESLRACPDCWNESPGSTPDSSAPDAGVEGGGP